MSDEMSAYCMYCGAPVTYGGRGRPRKFCSNRCRWSYDKYRQRHREEFENEDTRVKNHSGFGTKACGLQSQEETETGRQGI